MSSLHNNNWRARAGMNKGFLDHMLLGMKSSRFGEGEGEPARGSSCWECTSTKIAVTKESKPVKFQEWLRYGIFFKHLYVLGKDTRWHYHLNLQQFCTYSQRYLTYSQEPPSHIWITDQNHEEKKKINEKKSVSVERKMLAFVWLVWTDGFNCLQKGKMTAFSAAAGWPAHLTHHPHV